MEAQPVVRNQRIVNGKDAQVPPGPGCHAPRLLLPACDYRMQRLAEHRRHGDLQGWRLPDGEDAVGHGGVTSRIGACTVAD